MGGRSYIGHNPQTGQVRVTTPDELPIDAPRSSPGHTTVHGVPGIWDAASPTRPDLSTACQVSVSILRSALSEATDPTAIHSSASPLGGRIPPRRVKAPACRSTRASIHDYLDGRLRPTRRHAVEDHIASCTECTRAFTDVREASWTRRHLNQRLATSGLAGGRHRRTIRGGSTSPERLGRDRDVPGSER
ncbi:anti-sigma factor family protein [Promicromonospora umidemergens]|uniref:anti-sigma factor family protein n=1 Tax=Promicromonospora umidemergens TaxID=629679 RepID=UPI003556F4C4